MEHKCSRIVKGKRYTWNVVDLWQFVKNEKIEIEEKNVNEFNLNFNPWFISPDNFTIAKFIVHYGKVRNSNLSYPIILDPENNILDGVHRLVKSVLEGEEKINCVKLKFYPINEIPVKIETLI
jgi:hypothetical protein